MPIAVPQSVMSHAYVGTSGWNYKHWANGEFYPKDLRPAEWLMFFSKQFSTVEINNSFYRLPSEAAYKNWRTQVPPGFVFSVKASRFLTHIKRLKDPAGPLDLFFSRTKHLRERLGPILFQLPPRFKASPDRLQIFLDALQRHTKTLGVRSALEVRDASWLVGNTFDLLHRYNVALCLADWRDTHVTGPLTANFVYVRRHFGSAGGGNYGQQDLDRDVNLTREWLKSGLDVYMYFNNDGGGHAIRNAAYVQQALLNVGIDKRTRAGRSTKPRHSWRPL